MEDEDDQEFERMVNFSSSAAGPGIIKLNKNNLQTPVELNARLPQLIRIDLGHGHRVSAGRDSDRPTSP